MTFRVEQLYKSRWVTVERGLTVDEAKRASARCKVFLARVRPDYGRTA